MLALDFKGKNQTSRFVHTLIKLKSGDYICAECNSSPGLTFQIPTSELQTLLNRLLSFPDARLEIPNSLQNSWEITRELRVGVGNYGRDFMQTTFLYVIPVLIFFFFFLEPNLPVLSQTRGGETGTFGCEGRNYCTNFFFLQARKYPFILLTSGCVYFGRNKETYKCLGCIYAVVANTEQLRRFCRIVQSSQQTALGSW